MKYREPPRETGDKIDWTVVAAWVGAIVFGWVFWVYFIKGVSWLISLM